MSQIGAGCYQSTLDTAKKSNNFFVYLYVKSEADSYDNYYGDIAILECALREKIFVVLSSNCFFERITFLLVHRSLASA